MADLVDQVLLEAAEKEARYKTTQIHKDIDLEIDAGNLLCIDHNPLELKSFRSKKDFLKNLARENTQGLINKIWELDVERVEDTIVVKLPAPKTILPREKPIPKEKGETRWSAYAKLKGIQKRKKSRMVWNDELKEWLPRWGYKSAGDSKRDWVLEVPGKADIYEDQFAKKKSERKEKVAKNELQRLRNLNRNMKGKSNLPGLGLLPTNQPDKNQVTRALTEARISTASIGRFTDKLPKEKDEKGLGKKRKFEPNLGDFRNEKRQALDILNKVNSGKPILDANKAASQHIAAEEHIRASTKKSGKDKYGKVGKKGDRGKVDKGKAGKGKAKKGKAGKVGKPKGQGMPSVGKKATPKRGRKR